MQALNGEYGFSGGMKLYYRGLALLMGGVVPGRVFVEFVQAHRGRLDGSPPIRWAGVALIAVCLGMALVLWWQAGRRVQFELGRLRGLSASGRVLWEESLMDLTSAETFTAKGVTSLRLRWADQRRTVIFPDALDEALEKKVEELRGPPLVEEGEPAPLFVEPVVSGSAWKCSHCGEENPGTFGICWKCEKSREVDA